MDSPDFRVHSTWQLEPAPAGLVELESSAAGRPLNRATVTRMAFRAWPGRFSGLGRDGRAVAQARAGGGTEPHWQAGPGPARAAAAAARRGRRRRPVRASGAWTRRDST